MIWCILEEDCRKTGGILIEDYTPGKIQAILVCVIVGLYKETQTEVVWACFPFKTILQGTVKGGRRQGRQNKKDRKTTSGNRQAWSSPSPRGQWRTEKNGGNWL